MYTIPESRLSSQRRLQKSKSRESKQKTIGTSSIDDSNSALECRLDQLMTLSSALSGTPPSSLSSAFYSASLSCFDSVCDYFLSDFLPQWKPLLSAESLDFFCVRLFRRAPKWASLRVLGRALEAQQQQGDGDDNNDSGGGGDSGNGGGGSGGSFRRGSILQPPLPLRPHEGRLVAAKTLLDLIRSDRMVTDILAQVQSEREGDKYGLESNSAQLRAIESGRLIVALPERIANVFHGADSSAFFKLRSADKNKEEEEEVTMTQRTVYADVMGCIAEQCIAFLATSDSAPETAPGGGFEEIASGLCVQVLHRLMRRGGHQGVDVIVSKIVDTGKGKKSRSQGESVKVEELWCIALHWGTM